MEKYDIDGNGVLDSEEMTKLLKDIAEKESEIMNQLKDNEKESGALDAGPYTRSLFKST